MKSLRDTVLEAISSRRNRASFPVTPDKDLIIDWLEENGFRRIFRDTDLKGGSTTYENIRKITSSNEDRLYMTGDYNSPSTSWIDFGTRTKWFVIRTGEANKDKDAMRFKNLRIYSSLVIFDNIEEFAEKVNEAFV